MTATVSDALRMLGAAILIVLLTHEVWWAFKHLTCKPAHCECSLPHKFLAGLPLHGHTVTDATYWRAAASISATVAAGSSPRRVVMLRHMPRG